MLFWRPDRFLGIQPKTEITEIKNRFEFKTFVLSQKIKGLQVLWKQVCNWRKISIYKPAAQPITAKTQENVNNPE